MPVQQGENRVGALGYDLHVNCNEAALAKLRAAARRFVEVNYEAILPLVKAGSSGSTLPFSIAVSRGESGQTLLSVSAMAANSGHQMNANSCLSVGGFRACVQGEVRCFGSTCQQRTAVCPVGGETIDAEAAVMVDILLAAGGPASAKQTDVSQRASTGPLVSNAYDTEARGVLFRRKFPSVRGEYFIFYSHGQSHCRRMLTGMGFKETPLEQEDSRYRPVEKMAVMWCNGTNSAAKRKGGLGFYIVNRLRYRGLIANKCSLARCLKEFEMNHPRLVPAGLEAASFYPDTIHLNGSDAIKIFDKIRSHHGLFLLKPGHADCGEGITLHRSDGGLSGLAASLAAGYTGNGHKDMVMQRYVDRPLLLDGRKFDLRVYLLLVPNQRRGPGRRGLYAFCHPGYARLACRPYRLDSDDPLLHLTNQAVQQRDPAYAQVKEDTVWSPDRLNEHLNLRLQELGVPCVDWARCRLYPRIRAILGHVISISSSSLCDQQMSFELMGCDFLVDADFNVWLLEINSDPSLNKATSTLERIVTQAAEEAIGLAVEVLQLAARGRPVKRLVTRQDFCKIFSHTNTATLSRVMAEAGLSYPEYPLPASCPCN